MTFQAVPGTVEVVIDYLMSGAPTANVLHYYRPGTITQGQLDTLAAGQDSTVGFELGGVFTVTQQYVQTRVRKLETSEDLASSNGDSAFTGTQIETAMPNNVSLCVTLRTGMTGRSARGRFYMQPPDAGDFASPNVATTTYRDLVLEYVQALLDNASSNGWTPVIVSRFTGGAKRAEGVTFPITDILCRNLRFDSQRGRLPLPD